MKTKYIKVSVSDRLPDESTELYFYCNDGYCNAGDYNKDLNRFTDVDGARYSTEYIEYWLEEVNDYEKEMIEMLEWCRNYIIEEAKAVVPDLENLLTKIKQQ